MGRYSKIEWTDQTVNLWWGCYEVHAGCDNCYAKKQANRYHGLHLLWQQNGPRMLVKSWLKDLRTYQKEAAERGITYRIFMNSMSDIFEKSMPCINHDHSESEITTGEIRKQFFEVVDECPNLLFLLLTKRPSNIIKMIPTQWLYQPRANVMFGTSLVNQQTANTLLPLLLEVPGYHFLSIEPMIGNINLFEALNTKSKAKFSAYNIGQLAEKVQWVIVGGESGNSARSFHLAWGRYIKWQCKLSGIPFFFKQDSQASNPLFKDQQSFPIDLLTRDFPQLN